MKKKFIITFLGLSLGLSVLCGCKQLHLHSIDVPFEYSDAEHWKTCSSCEEQFMVGEHVFNDLTNKCLVCDYVDPIIVTDENGVMTGLTTHGKTKAVIDLPSSVLYVASDALVDSKVLLLNLDKELVGYYEGAFDKENLIVKTAEEEVTWELKDNIYYKHDTLSEYDASIDGVLYKTLEEAFEAVETNDTTITVLKDDLVVDHPIVVDHTVTLEGYHIHQKLDCDFSINSGCTLYVPKAIALTGDVRLMLADTIEEYDDEWAGVYSPGAVAFMNTDTKPENVKVAYVKDFDVDIDLGSPAVGHKQVANSLIVALPVTHYAYGTFVFSKDFKQIFGLSAYGETVSDLYITNVVEGINAVIPSHAFSIYTDIKINIHKIKDTHITLNQTKGFFTSLHISDGITSVGPYAFNNITTDDIFHEVKSQMGLLLSHIMYLEIGDSVTTICEHAFDGQLSIKEVRGGKGLTSIGQYAFYENVSLHTVDFSEAYNLSSVAKRAFSYCDSLLSVHLPEVPWTIRKDKKKTHTYFPGQLDPEMVAYVMIYENQNDTWERNNGGKIGYTSDTSKDSTGRYNQVSFTNSLAGAINACADGGWVWLLEGTPEDQRHIDLSTITKSISIFADPSLDNVTIGKEGEDLVINNNTYLTLSNVMPVSPIVLKNEKVGNGIVQTGGFAIRNDNDKLMPDVSVFYDSDNLVESVANASKANLVDGGEYYAYGLFRFANIYNELGFIQQQTITGTSKLGSLAKKVEITVQYLNMYCYASTDVVVGLNAFYGNTQLQHVVFDRHLLRIEASAFENCTNLKTVELVEDTSALKFESIGEKAFMGCTQLERFSISETQSGETAFKVIEANAFKNCQSLVWLDFGDAKREVWTIDGSGTAISEDCSIIAKLMKMSWTKKWYL